MLKIPKYPNLTELTYLQVKQAILQGTLSEGSKLTEEVIASQFGISKSPVREALNRLESEGLVSIESRRGAYVRTFSAKEARDLYDLRVVLEVHAVGLAKITPDLLNRLDESIKRTRQNLDQDSLISHVKEDIHFHSLIAEATGNLELCRVLGNLNQKSILCRLRTYRLSAFTAPESHGRIYDALKQGDFALAQQCMRDHILFVRDALMRSMGNQHEFISET